MTELSSAAKLQRRTLVAGIVIGVLGLLIVTFGDMLLMTYGSDGQADLLVLLSRAVATASYAFLPFAGALIAAALVMRYWDLRLRALDPGDEADNDGGERHSY